MYSNHAIQVCQSENACDVCSNSSFAQCPLNCISICIAVHHHQLECHVKNYDCCFQIQAQGHNGGSAHWTPQLLIYSVSYELYFESFATKLCVVEHHDESELCVKHLDCCLQVEGQRAQVLGDKDTHTKKTKKTVFSIFNC